MEQLINKKRTLFVFIFGHFECQINKWPYQQLLHSLSILQFLSPNLHVHYERPPDIPHITTLFNF